MQPLRWRALTVVAVLVATGALIATRPARLGLDLRGGTQIALEAADTAGRKIDGDTINRTLEVLRRRVDQLGVAEPTLQRSGDRRIIEAHEFALDPENLRAAPGTVAIEYVNAGSIPHTLVIDGVNGVKLDVASKGDVDTGAVKLEPGTYTLYCDIPGHRQAGMEAPLTVG